MRFCPFCGNEMAWEGGNCPTCGNFVNVPAPGFSTRASDPSLMAAADAEHKGNLGIGVLIFPIAIGVVVLNGFMTEWELEMMVPAFAIAAVLLAIVGISTLAQKLRYDNEKPWDGTVVEKKTKRRTVNEGDSDNPELVSYTAGIVVFQTDDGKKKKVEEPIDEGKYYNYFRIGERVRYHPKFVYRYEKYDKTKDDVLYCPICAKQNKITADKCDKCGNLLLR